MTPPARPAPVHLQLRRQHEGRQASRTTVRMLESLVRVAQAHARLMARHEVRLARWGGMAGCAGGRLLASFAAGTATDVLPPASLQAPRRRPTPRLCPTNPAQVTLQDAVIAVWVMEQCAGDAQHSPLSDVVVGCGTAVGGAQPFPADPDAEYVRLQEALVAAVRAGAAQHTPMIEY